MLRACWDTCVQGLSSAGRNAAEGNPMLPRGFSTFGAAFPLECILRCEEREQRGLFLPLELRDTPQRAAHSRQRRKSTFFPTEDIVKLMDSLLQEVVMATS